MDVVEEEEDDDDDEKEEDNQSNRKQKPKPNPMKRMICTRKENVNVKCGCAIKVQRKVYCVK
jgi:hypothetical protein